MGQAMKTDQYLDAAKKKLGLPSDYALGKVLGVSTSRFGNWRSHRAVPELTIAVRLAEILEVDPLRVIADLELERGRDPDLWRRVLRRAACVAVAALGAAGLPYPTQNAAASPLGPQSSSEARLCIMSNRRRRRPRLAGSAALGFLRTLAAL